MRVHKLAFEGVLFYKMYMFKSLKLSSKHTENLMFEENVFRFCKSALASYLCE